MKILFKPLIVLVNLLLVQSALAEGFVEGTHFTIIKDTQVSESREIVEYFSFSCPGCNAIEPYVKALKQDLPSVRLRRVHVPFGGQRAKLSQRAFVLAKLLNAETHYEAIFNRIHQKRNVFNDEAELSQFFQDLGYDRITVENAMKSFSADHQIRKMNSETKKKGISSIPEIRVNGKYRVDTGAVYSGTDLAKLIEFLNDLTGLPSPPPQGG